MALFYSHLEWFFRVEKCSCCYQGRLCFLPASCATWLRSRSSSLSPCSELLIPFVNFAQGLRPESAFTFSNANFLLGLYFQVENKVTNLDFFLEIFFHEFFQRFHLLKILVRNYEKKALKLTAKAKRKAIVNCNLILLARKFKVS